MSCTFWLRRHKAAAKKRAEEAQLKAEAEKQATNKEIVVEKQATEEKVFNEEPVVEVKKPRKKAVKSDDNT